jgi:predicted RNase H-like nuclease (RuvC/YqgF family)
MMTPEEQVKRLEAVNTRLEVQLRNLKKDKERMIKSFNSYSRDRWYIAYLQVELMRLEAQYSSQQDCIEDLLAENRRLKEVTESFNVL